MKTDTLIDLLATGAGPAPRHPFARRLLPAALGGLALAIGLSIGLFGRVPASGFGLPGFWAKTLYGLLLAVCAGAACVRLAQPLARWQPPVAGVAGAVLLMGAVGWMALWTEPAEGRMLAWLGHSWRVCPLVVLALSLPGLLLTLRALRRFAPVRPRAVGALAGIAAGALGAIGYAMSCSEMALPFVASWYTAGIALAALLGAAIGPKLLRG